MFYSACIPAVFGGQPIDRAMANVSAAGLKHYEFWGWNEEQYGLTPVAMCTTYHELTNPNGREAYVEGIRKTIPVCLKLGCRNIISQVGPERSDISRQAQHESIVAGLKAAAPYVEEAGLTLVFEPLNTRIDHVGYYLIVANIDKIGHFHMAGHPGRHEPLIDSEVDYATILTAIRKSGYPHAVGLEYFPVHPAEEGLKDLYSRLLTF